jgi:hypothetical protein
VCARVSNLFWPRPGVQTRATEYQMLINCPDPAKRIILFQVFTHLIMEAGLGHAGNRPVLRRCCS